ncbi:universal stress protein family [Halalkalibacter wakoensis JCM 9140]|uniref:Universal stress protein family n=1 Tax=Halalkalibacter wakoensis JCM 9140 TaxID=1236970 RepID=W4Q2J1_9BACI|nr:universal stress protein [Halalkalibacter wakoensis]GAE26301.1 universal stress protein family [Halalkalibacter wakoensis JCM 9140]
MFKSILLASDGSEHSYRAAEKAAELAKIHNGKVTVVYSIDGSTSKADVLTNNSKFEIERKRKEKLAPIIEIFTKEGINHSLNIIQGEPGPTIVKFANEGDYDCVVIGSRGLNKLQTMVLGSVSHKVAKRVEVPVLIVK